MKLFIYGAGGHAKVVADVARLSGYNVVGFLDTVSSERKNHKFSGAEILGGEECLDLLLRTGCSAAVAIGDCPARLRVALKLQSKGFALPILKHPSAVIAPDTMIKPGTIICAGAIVQPASAIGTACILNTACSVGHDCTLSDGVHISSGSRIAGTCTIGAATWIGVGSVVSDHISIGSHAMIGAGSVVVRDIPDSVTAYGNPARVKKIH